MLVVVEATQVSELGRLEHGVVLQQVFDVTWFQTDNEGRRWIHRRIASCWWTAEDR